MKNKINNFVLLLLIIIGFFFPTSIDSIILKSLTILHSLILLVSLIVFMVTNKMNKYGFFFALAINILLLSFTIIAPIFNNSMDYALGGYLPYILLSLIYCISFSSIKLSPILNKIFILANIAIITLGLIIVFKLPLIFNTIISNYSTAYPQLLYNMLAYKKPVTVFGSHSIASFFYYLLFYMSFITYKTKRQKLYLLLAVGNLVLIFYLKSVSSYVFLAIGAVQLVYLIVKKSKYLAFITIPVFVVAASKLFNYSRNNMVLVFSSNSNGFTGRFSEYGALSNTIDYISSNIIPIGLGTVNGLYYTDSGLVVNYLKGGILLVIAVYLGLFLFLKHNIKNTVNAYWLFFIFFIFSFGFPILDYLRTLYFLPFMVVYFNNLSDASSV